MLRFLTVAAIVAAFAFAPAFAVGQTSSDNSLSHVGGLTCFSIQPPDKPTNNPGSRATHLYRTCDELCAERHAACTAATSNYNPMRSCASTDYNPSSTLCRCCATDH